MDSNWPTYIVRWHTGHNKMTDEHTIKQKYFTDENQAEGFYEGLGFKYAKKLLTPTSVKCYSEEWAQYIPGGVNIKPFMASYHTEVNDEVHTTIVRYFNDEEMALNFYNSIDLSYAKKLSKPYETISYSADWAKYLCS